MSVSDIRKDKLVPTCWPQDNICSEGSPQAEKQRQRSERIGPHLAPSELPSASSS